MKILRASETVIGLSASALPAVVLVLAGCSDDPHPQEPVQQYTVTLEEAVLLKEGSSERLTVEGLPADGATLVDYPPD